MTPADFLTRWQASGGAERANYGLFLNDLTALLGVPPPDAVTDDPARDAYVLEKPVTFNDGAGKKSTGRIDLYKRGCFVPPNAPTPPPSATAPPPSAARATPCAAPPSGSK
jgi:hypothetical protein